MKVIVQALYINLAYKGFRVLTLDFDIALLLSLRSKDESGSAPYSEKVLRASEYCLFCPIGMKRFTFRQQQGNVVELKHFYGSLQIETSEACSVEGEIMRAIIPCISAQDTLRQSRSKL